MMIPTFFIRGLAVFFVVSCGIFVDSSSVQAASFGVNLYADKLVIPPGGSATIDWTISYGSNPDFPYSCSGNFGNFMVSSPTGSGYASGVFSPVTPAGTTTYRVTCSSAGSVTPVTGEKTITVSSKPVVSLKANPAALPEVGGSTLISWKVDLATSCVATDGDARWRGLSGLPQGGGLTWDLTTTTQFSLECFNDAKASSGKQTIQVYVGPPCGNKIIDPGEQCDEGINNDDTCKKSECSSDCQYLGGQICSQVGKDPVCGNGVLEETFDHGVSIGEICDNGSANNGGCPKLCSGSCSVNTCSGGMTVHLDAGGNGSAGEPPYMNPGYGSGHNGIKLGDAIPIYYTVANAVSCTASGEGFSPSKLAPSSDGIVLVTPTTLGTYTWTLDCTDKNGQVLRRTDFYDVYSNLDVEILSFAATPKPVPFSSDGKVQFSWTGNNLGTCTISGATPSQVVDDNGGSATITYTPSQRKSYGAKGVTVTLNCKKGQSSEHSEVTVYFESDPALPPSVNFWINNNPGPSMTASSGAVLIPSWEVSGAARCYSTNFLYKGKNEIVPPAPGIKPTSQVTFKTNTTYSLECWNAPEYGSLSTKKSIEVISGSGQPPTPTPLPPTPPVGGGGGTPTPPLVPSPSADSPSLIPCGRNIDDKNTSDIDETKPCTLCHIVLGGQKLISWGLRIMSIIAITVIFAMGVLYILSAGNSSMMETAKGGMIASLIGFAVMLSAYLIVNVVLTILVDTASPDKPFLNLTATQGYFNFACDITSNVNGK